MITKKFAFEKQQRLYPNKVIRSLTPVQRLGNQVHNCKMAWTTAPLVTLKSQSRYNQKENQMNICNLFGEEVDAKAHATTPKGKEGNFRSRLLDLRISGKSEKTSL